MLRRAGDTGWRRKCTDTAAVDLDELKRRQSASVRVTGRTTPNLCTVARSSTGERASRGRAGRLAETGCREQERRLGGALARATRIRNARTAESGLYGRVTCRHVRPVHGLLQSQLPIANSATCPPPRTMQCRVPTHFTMSKPTSAATWGTACTAQCRPPSKVTITLPGLVEPPTATHS